MNKTEIFIKRAKVIHGDKYLYEKSIYTKPSAKIIITCKNHGDFEQIASNHIRGSNCSI